MIKTLLNITLIATAGFAFLSCGTSGRTTLTLKYNSPDSVTLYQMRPIDGMANFCSDTITLAGDTTLVQSFETGDAAHYEVYTHTSNGVNRMRLLLQDGGNTIVEYIPSAPRPFIIDSSSTSATGQLMYDSIGGTRNIYERFRSFSTAPIDTVGSIMQKNFRAMADSETALFDSLHKAGEIDSRMLAQATNEINYYYATRMASVITDNVMSAKRGYMPRVYDGYADLWDTIYTQYPIDEAAARTCWGWHYAAKYTLTNDYVSNPETPFPDFKTEAEYLKSNWDNLKKTIATATPKAQESILATQLWSDGINNKSHELMLDTLITEFGTKFQDSKYNPSLRRFIDENREYYEVMARPMSERVLFMEDPESYKSLDDVLAKFRGAPIFVDFWFSSCGPCRDEFAYAARTYDFLTQNGITPLFISIDPPKKEQQWRDAIKFFNLEGNHLRMVTDELSHDIFDAHKINSFPTYMIVDKDGKIVVSNARRPSQGEELYQQIKEKLQL